MCDPRELGPTAYKEGGSDYHGPRSRYSGVPFFPKKLVFTIIVTLEGTGHAHVVFEWDAMEKKKMEWDKNGVWGYAIKPADQRNHHLFHLVPHKTEEERKRGFQPRSSALTLRTRGGEIHYSQDKFEEFPGKHGPTAYRSWEVCFAKGMEARNAAYDTIYNPPRFNLSAWSDTYNCSEWTIEIAKMAGVDPTNNPLTLVKCPQIPRLLVDTKQLVESEDEMWRKREPL